MKHYWDKEIEKLDKIYGEAKNPLEKIMDHFRKDLILERAQIVYGLTEQLDRGAIIVDLGCGTGRQSFELAKRGFKVYGFDISERAIELAKLHMNDSGVNVIFEDCDIVKKEYPKCDLIIGLGLMDYLRTDEVLLVLKKVRKLNCKFVFSFPFKCTKSYIRFIYRYVTGTRVVLRSTKEISDQLLFSGFGQKEIRLKKLGASLVVHNFQEN